MIFNTVTTALTFIYNAEVCKETTGQTIYYGTWGDADHRPMLRYEPTGTLSAHGEQWTRFHTVLGIDNAYYLGDGDGFLPIQVLLDRAMECKDRGYLNTDDVLLVVTILRTMHQGWSFNEEWKVPLCIDPITMQKTLGSVKQVIAQFFTPRDVIGIDGLGLEMELLNWESIMYVDYPDDLTADPVDVRDFPWGDDDSTLESTDDGSIIEVWENDEPPVLEDEELILLIDLTLNDDEE
jgi:hypothetical protein